MSHLLRLQDQSAHEPASDTVRQFIAAAWDASAKGFDPYFVSEGGVNTSAAGSRGLSSAALASLERDATAYCKFYEGDTRTLNSSKSTWYGETDVYCDIYGRHAVMGATLKSQMLLIRDHVDGTILNNQTGPYPQSRDGNDSAIMAIAPEGIDWERIGEDGEKAISEQYSGIIECRWQRSKTN